MLSNFLWSFLSGAPKVRGPPVTGHPPVTPLYKAVFAVYRVDQRNWLNQPEYAFLGLAFSFDNRYDIFSIFAILYRYRYFPNSNNRQQQKNYFYSIHPNLRLSKTIDISCQYRYFSSKSGYRYYRVFGIGIGPSLHFAKWANTIEQQYYGPSPRETYCHWDEAVRVYTIVSCSLALGKMASQTPKGRVFADR